MVNGLALSGLEHFGGACIWCLDWWHSLFVQASRLGEYFSHALASLIFNSHVYLDHENSAFEKAQRIHHYFVEKLRVK